MEEENKDNSQEGFISRWAKKKANKNSKTTFVEENDDDAEKLNLESGIEELDSEQIEDESQYDELNDEELLEKFKLPNPEKVKKEKGLDLFFKDGVPDRLRQIALRRVWKLNPIIRYADADINDYHEDFTDAATVIEGMKTAYQVGKGYLSALVEEDDKDKDDDEKENDNDNEKKEEGEKKSNLQKSPKENLEQEKTIIQDEKTELNSKKEDKNNLNQMNETTEDVKDEDYIEPINIDKEEFLIQPTFEEKPKPKMMVFKPRT
jgi:hypothetical protein